MAETNIENNFVSLSYDSYLETAEKAFKNVKTTEVLILNEYDAFTTTMKLQKEQYATMSSEDNEGKASLKENFIKNIKTMFLKIWEFIVDVFSKLCEIVISLIKSLIIFIQKKRIQSANIIKSINEKGIVGYKVNNGKIFEKILSDDLVSINSITDLTDPNSFVANHIGIFSKLTSKNLKTFVELPILVKNNESIFNVDSLNKYLLTEVNKDDESVEEKINVLEEASKSFYAYAVFGNEVDPKHNKYKNTDLFMQVAPYLLSKDINSAAHDIVMGITKPKQSKISIAEYFQVDNKISNPNSVFKILSNSFRQYTDLTNLILGNNGYLSKLEDILKRYKERAKEDQSNIKAMQKYITKVVEDMNSETYNEKISHRYNRFTNIIMNVKNAKTHFIRLRQCVIIDILTLFSIENKAWVTLTGKGALLKDADEIKPEDTTPSIFRTDNAPELALNK